MTDTMTEAPKQQAVVSLDALAALKGKIDHIDQQIGAASGSEKAVRESVVSQIETETAAHVGPVVSSFIENFRQLPVEVRVAFASRLPDAIAETVGGEMDAYVDERVAAITKGVDANVEPLKAQRKDILSKFQALREVLDMLSIDTSSVPEPKRSAGGRSSGSRSSGGSSTAKGLNKDRYRFYIDDKAQPPSQNTRSALAYHATDGCAPNDAQGKKVRWGVEQFFAHLVEKGINYGPPGEGDDNWEVTLPNGKVVKARRLDESNPEDKVIFDAAAKSDDSDDDENGSDETPAQPAVAPEPGPVADPASQVIPPVES